MLSDTSPRYPDAGRGQSNLRYRRSATHGVSQVIALERVAVGDSHARCAFPPLPWPNQPPAPKPQTIEKLHHAYHLLLSAE